MKYFRKILSLTLSLAFVVILLLQSSCGHTVYVRQNGQTYNDYEAIKHDRIEKVDTRPKRRKQEKFKKYKKKRRKRWD